MCMTKEQLIEKKAALAKQAEAFSKQVLSQLAQFQGAQAALDMLIKELDDAEAVLADAVESVEEEVGDGDYDIAVCADGGCLENPN